MDHEEQTAARRRDLSEPDPDRVSRLSRAADSAARDRVNCRVLTVEEVAAMLQISPRTVYRLNDRGKIPQPIRLGRSVRWNYREIEEWIAIGCPSPSL